MCLTCIKSLEMLLYTCTMYRILASDVCCLYLPAVSAQQTDARSNMSHHSVSSRSVSTDATLTWMCDVHSIIIKDLVAALEVHAQSLMPNHNCHLASTSDGEFHMMPHQIAITRFYMNVWIVTAHESHAKICQAISCIMSHNTMMAVMIQHKIRW